MNNTILITGGGGVVGSRLVRRFSDQGSEARVLDLPGGPPAGDPAAVSARRVEADVTDPESLLGSCTGIHTVFHLAAVIITRDPAQYQRINVAGTRNMVDEAIRAGVKHFVLISSVAATDPDSSPYARSKYEAEQIVKSQQDMAWTIVRPTLVYEQGGGQEYLLFVEGLERFPLVPFIGSGRAMKNPVYGEDIIQGLAAIAGNSRSHFKTYSFSGGEAVTLRELARLVLLQRGTMRPFIHLPLWLCRPLVRLGEWLSSDFPLSSYGISRIEADANPDNSDARRDLGYAPIGVREGLQKCYPRSR